jgi:hypothetical protein
MTATVDEHDVLHTAAGNRVAKLRLDAGMLVDRSMIVYGPSRTGKTVIIKTLMQILSARIEQCVVVSPSEATNRSYSGCVADQFIHYRMYMPGGRESERDGALRFLTTIWSRQEMMASIYTRANRIEPLEQLFRRIPRGPRMEAVRYLVDMDRNLARAKESLRLQYAADPGRHADKLGVISEKFNTMRRLVYKKYITPHHSALWAADLDENERYSLMYLKFNPRLLLVFDDCAAQMKDLHRYDIYRKFFYQNRHSFITLIIAAQDDTDIHANLRKNAFISFFTEPIVCMSNFGRASNAFPVATRRYVTDVAGVLFQRYRKLAYIREDDARKHFYWFEFAIPAPFQFGSRALLELCAAVRATETTMDRENPFYTQFKI